jgi:hypothetical protein
MRRARDDTAAESSTTSRGEHVEGHFTHGIVRVRWTVEEDGESGENGGKAWVLQVRIVDVSICRRYPTKISQIEAEREARLIVPMLLPIAAAWLKK